MKNFSIKIFIALLALAGVITVASAQLVPPSTPPGGNVFPPINTSNVDQTKQGGITAQFFTGLRGFFKSPGVCINIGGGPCSGPNVFEAGVTSTLNASGPLNKGLIVGPTGDFFIKDGNQAAGKVLTSNADGMATWETPGGTPPPGTSPLPTPARNGATLWYDAVNQKWEQSQSVSNYLHINTPAFNGFEIFKSGNALNLRGVNHTYMEWRPTGTGNNGEPQNRAWVGFGTAGNNLFTIKNEMASSSNNPASILLQPNTGGNVMIADAGGVNAGLYVGGKVQIAGGNPGTDKILVSDTNGVGNWKDIESVANSSQFIAGFSTNIYKWNELGSRGCNIGGAGSNCYVSTNTHMRMACPAGEILMSGGVACSEGEFRESMPYRGNGTPQWRVDCGSANNSNRIQDAYIMCLKPQNAPALVPDSNKLNISSGSQNWVTVSTSGLQNGNSGESCLAWVRRFYNDNSIQSNNIRIWNNGGYQIGQCRYRDSALTSLSGEVNTATFTNSNRRPTNDNSLQVLR